MSDLLSDEEIKVVCVAIMAQYGEGRDDEPTVSSLVATFRAKAQAKKLVEWLDETYNSLKAQGGFQISREEWQALQKEVKDG